MYTSHWETSVYLGKASGKSKTAEQTTNNTFWSQFCRIVRWCTESRLPVYLIICGDKALISSHNGIDFDWYLKKTAKINSSAQRRTALMRPNVQFIFQWECDKIGSEWLHFIYFLVRCWHFNTKCIVCEYYAEESSCGALGRQSPWYANNIESAQ